MSPFASAAVQSALRFSSSATHSSAPAAQATWHGVRPRGPGSSREAPARRRSSREIDASYWAATCVAAPPSPISLDLLGQMGSSAAGSASELYDAPLALACFSAAVVGVARASAAASA